MQIHRTIIKFQINPPLEYIAFTLSVTIFTSFAEILFVNIQICVLFPFNATTQFPENHFSTFSAVNVLYFVGPDFSEKVQVWNIYPHLLTFCYVTLHIFRLLFYWNLPESKLRIFKRANQTVVLLDDFIKIITV